MQEEEEDKFLTPVFRITDSWLWALIYLISQIYLGSGAQLLEVAMPSVPSLTED